jgi:lysophospholipase L1-like esterase
MEWRLPMRKTLLALACALISACGNSSTPNNLVVMMGDSITCYWNDPGWQSESKALISAHLPHVVDVGIGGQTTEEMWDRFQEDVLDQHPGTIIIEGGTNDVELLHSVDTQYLFKMVAAAQSAGALVIVGNLPPAPDHDEELASWRMAIIKGRGTYGYELADYYHAMLEDGVQNKALFFSDHIHPISAGYDVMWSVLAPLMPQEVLSGAPTAAPTNNRIC